MVSEASDIAFEGLEMISETSDIAFEGLEMIAEARTLLPKVWKRFLRRQTLLFPAPHILNHPMSRFFYNL